MKAKEDEAVVNSTVSVQVPSELDANDTIVFCMMTWPEAKNLTASAADVLHDNRLIGLSVRGQRVSALQEPVNITVTLPADETLIPRCVFLNFSTKSFSSAGCETQWNRSQSVLTCSCSHLTYFGVLLVSPSSSVSATDLQILSTITLIGCSLSLVALLVTVLLFITNRKLREDVSSKVHINLAIALILLNLHFLSSQWVASLSSSGLCLYVGLLLHWSLLASFSWTGLEGFHLYLLLVRVYNIYIRRYLLKLSVVGWGLPVLMVVVVVAVDRDAYGLVPLDSSAPNSTQICYIVEPTVKMASTLGVFVLVFLFNGAMLLVTVRRIVGLRLSEEQFGQRDQNRAKRDACTLLGVSTLLGVTWGLIFFSFGSLTTAGLYLFCILNPLQGFFLFLWFVMSWKKSRNPTTNTSSATTHSTNS
ncbi:adhesion G-protein coupled receptor G1-like [Clinocottus analis]|uniref:adhesion G-protein coupled receptor G1-like n=1 Tax=Clinocottus analis TaxID=304258 RepID=UPI0035C035EE